MVHEMLAVSVTLLVSVLVIAPFAVHGDSIPVTFYPFGTAQGDNIAPVNDDGFTSAIPTAGNGFPFFGTYELTIFVNTNGGISFGSGYGSYTPQPFPVTGVPLIAVYWADVDTRENPGRIYYRLTTDAALLSRASDDVRASFSATGFGSFSATWIFIATWYNVTYFGGSATTPTDTFQCVLITNGVNSFVMFNYGTLTWTTGTASGGNALTGLGGTPAQVGFNYGDATNYYAVPTSRTGDIVNINQQSNIGITGRWMFRVDQLLIRSAGCQFTPACNFNPNTGLCQGSGLCNYFGDPHYISFDGKRFDYQGVCKYLVAGSVQIDNSQPSFQVLGRNEYRYSYTAVSWFLYVEIVYGNDVVRFTRGQPVQNAATTVVTVNGAVVSVPYCKQLYSVYFSGIYVRYQALFGLAVETDGISIVNVYVPPAYRNRLTGVCGNFDAVSTNDLIRNNVDYSSQPWQFGDSFIVSDNSTDYPSTSCQTASQTPLNASLILPSTANRCQQLVDPNGVFGVCVSSLDAANPGTSTTIYNDCLLDASVNDSAICQHVFNLVDTCAFRGFQINCSSWQTVTGCSVACPAGMVYECNSNQVCLPTCDNPVVSTSCTRPQRGACVCPLGQLFYNGICSSSCPLGCVDSNNNIHPIGDSWNRNGCGQLTCAECASCPYGNQIVSISACGIGEICSSDNRCVAGPTTTNIPTTTPFQGPNSYLIYNANGGVLTYRPNPTSLNGLALVTTDNILLATAFTFITPCLSAQVPNANLSSGQCITLQAFDGSSLVAVNVMGGVSMMTTSNIQTQFPWLFNVDASIFLLPTTLALNAYSLQSVEYSAFYYASPGVNQPVFMYYNNGQLPSSTSYYFTWTYTGPSTVSTTCPNVWTLTNNARPVNLGTWQGNFTISYCRQLCLVYPNCIGVTIQNGACTDGVYPCFFTIAGATDQSLVLDPAYIHFDLSPIYPSRCTGACLITWVSQNVTVTSTTNPPLYVWTSQTTPAICRDQCRPNSFCIGITWSSGVCSQYYRGSANGTLVLPTNLTLLVPQVNSLCGQDQDRSSPIVNVLVNAWDSIATTPTGVNGYDACYTLCVNNAKCTGFQLQAGRACYLSFGTQPTSNVGPSYTFFEVRRTPSGNGCQNQWILFSNVYSSSSVPYAGSIVIQSEQDCRTACLSAAVINRSACVGIDYNQSTSSCRFNNATLTASAFITDPSTSAGWNHFELTLSSNCFDGL